MKPEPLEIDGRWYWYLPGAEKPVSYPTREAAIEAARAAWDRLSEELKRELTAKGVERP